jgi:hypothetical protein
MAHHYLIPAALLAGLTLQASEAVAQATITKPAPSVGTLTEAPTPIPATATSRHPAYVRLSLGMVYDINMYYRCARLSAEYAPMLTRHLGLASRLVGVGGHPSGLENKVPNQNYKAAYVEQEVTFYPVGGAGDTRVRFGVGAGGFAGYYQKNTFDFFNAVGGEIKDYALTERHGFHGGYLYSANLEVALNADRRWLVGARAARQSGIGGITTQPAYTLTLARRL